MYKWAENFSVEIPEIDVQHKEMFRMAEKAYVLLNSDNVNILEVVGLFDGLTEYTSYHFKTEEDLFKKYKYPYTASHVAEHQNFINYLASLDIYSQGENHKKAIEDILIYITNWIAMHILDTDKKYQEFLTKKLKEQN